MNATIDAHQHFWQLSRPFNYGWLDAPELWRDPSRLLPDDLGPLIRNQGVDRTIFVQTQHDLEENRWVLGLAERTSVHRGGGRVGRPGFGGLREPGGRIPPVSRNSSGSATSSRTSPTTISWSARRFFGGSKVLERHGVPFDLLLYVKHLRHVPTLARALPGLPMVIDHLAKPRIKDHSIDDWLPGFREAASFPNVFCKLSGMVTEADWDRWTADDLRPYVQTGPRPLRAGSPDVRLGLAGLRTGRDLWRGPRRVGRGAGTDLGGGTAAIFGGTAARFYGIGDRTP